MKKEIAWERVETWSVPMYTGTTGCPVDSVEMGAVLTGIVDLLSDKIFLENKGLNWNCLKIELWSDSGSVLLMPGDRRSSDRIEKVGVHLIVEEIRKVFGKFSERGDDDALEIEVGRLEKAFIEKVRALVTTNEVRARLVAHGVQELRVHEFDEREPLSVIQLV